MDAFRISTAQLKPGMIVATDITTSSGNVIVAKNTILNPKLISKLKLYHITVISVFIPKNIAARIQETTEQIDKQYENQERSSVDFKRFRSAYQAATASIQSVFQTLQSNKQVRINTEAILSPVMDLLGSSRTNMQLLERLQYLREFNDVIYVHSISVSMIAHTIAVWLHYPEEAVVDITLAGLLHDLGKLCISGEILDKPSKLSDAEFEQIKKHPEYGYQMLRSSNVSTSVKEAVLKHHERCDGSGYPAGLKQEEIPEYAKIIAIADVYDAMTSNRSYRKPICPFDVVDILEQEGYRKYDPSILLPFLENIVQSYLNIPVRLSNSLIGTVVMINKHALSKPIIKVDNMFLDLSKLPDISITEIL